MKSAVNEEIRTKAGIQEDMTFVEQAKKSAQGILKSQISCEDLSDRLQRLVSVSAAEITSKIKFNKSHNNNFSKKNSKKNSKMETSTPAKPNFILKTFDKNACNKNNPINLSQIGHFIMLYLFILYKKKEGQGMLFNFGR